MIVVQINLLESSFKPKGKLYEKVQWCMQHTLTQKYQFLIYSAKGIYTLINTYSKI